MVSRKTALLLLSLAAACGSPLVAGAGELGYETTRNVTYAQRDDRPLRADVYKPIGKGPFPAVLCVHGGAWIGGDKTQLAHIARMLAKHAYVAVAISYRLAPRHKFPAQIEDCRDAVRWMRSGGREFGIDPKRIAGWGYSAGGHLVALLGVTGDDDEAGKSTRLRAVVACGAPCDFQNIPPDNQGMSYWLGDTRRRKPEAYRLASPIQFVSPDDPPTLFLHGQNDRLVKIDQPVAMAARLKASGVDAKMYVIPDAGHLRAFLNDDASAEATKFLDKQLK